jgi:excisionase family DNA binding protein
MHEPTLTKAEVARCLGVTRATIYSWIARGIVPTIKVDGRDRIPASVVRSPATVATMETAAAFPGFRKVPFCVINHQPAEAPQPA